MFGLFSVIGRWRRRRAIAKRRAEVKRLAIKLDWLDKSKFKRFTEEVEKENEKRPPGEKKVPTDLNVTPDRVRYLLEEARMELAILEGMEKDLSRAEVKSEPRKYS